MLKRSLGTISLMAVVFFNVSGGPYSTEGLVVTLGPGLALLMLAVIPVVWALPETLIVAELSSMLPTEGGYYRWVRRAFGPFWGFQNGWTTWLYSLVDMAIYPVLFNSYLAWFVPGVPDGARWAVSLAVIWGAAAINLRGALPVGRVSVVSGAFVLAAFAALAVCALPNATHSPFTPFSHDGGGPGALFAVGLSTALWNFIGWDNASTVSEEVRDPGHSYPRALFTVLPLITASYFVALIPALAATDWTTWTEGGWPAIAMAAAGKAGPFIAGWIALAGMVSALALFNALLLSYSRIPLAMANDGLLPDALGRTDRRGTPRNAVIAAAVCYSVFTLLPFAKLVVADVILYALALVMELSALVALRRREPDLRGAFRIPLGTRGVTILAALPAAMLATLVWLSFADGESALPAAMVSGGAVLAGVPLYFWRRRVLVGRESAT
jgi:amino acid transporter